LLAEPAIVRAGKEAVPDAVEKAAALGWCVAAVAGLIAIGIVVQDGVTPLTVVLAAVAVVPFVLDALDIFLPRLAVTTLVVPVAIVLDGRASQSQANASAALFLLVLLCGHTAAIGSLTETFITLAPIEGWLLYQHASAPPHFGVGWFGWIVGCLLSAGMGWTLHRELELFLELHQAQSELAEQAFQQERRRIAREVHDVIAHSLTVTMLHLTGARLTLEHDPSATAEAIAALEEAERAGRHSLNEIRRTVGLLAAPGGDQPTTEPLPGATDVDALVQDFRAAGLHATLTTSGDPTAVSAASGLALYRIVQESLTNAAKHAPGAPVIVEIAVGADIHVVIRNPITRVERTSEGGLGIAGMVERVFLLGGTLAAGPGPGGWMVDAHLPNVATLAAPTASSATGPTTTSSTDPAAATATA
jgi:signal transduction histidine kinase